jgi:signal transduction histidine kinase
VVHAVAVNVLSLVEQCLSALQLLIVAKGLIVDVKVRGASPAPSDTFLIRSEQLLVFFMLANLLKNAAEASPSGGTLFIPLRDNPHGKDTVAEISIHNAGAIPAPIPERFFQKFATEGKEHGTGIGAYSARLMARTLGDDTRVESSEEKGTTITVQLPLA